MLDWPPVGGVFFEGIVNAIFVMIVHVITDQSAKMLFIQRDDIDMVQDLAAATSYPALGNAILPGRLDACPLGSQTRRLQEQEDLSVEFRIPVQNHVTVWSNVREGFTQLLDHPLRSRMSSDV